MALDDHVIVRQRSLSSAFVQQKMLVAEISAEIDSNELLRQDNVSELALDWVFAEHWGWHVEARDVAKLLQVSNAIV